MSNGKGVSAQITALEKEIQDKARQLAELKRAEAPQAIEDYTLAGIGGPVRLSELFDGKSDLIVVHNMGRDCPYCTLWADGFNGLYLHLLDRAGFALVSPDDPATQHEFAQSRGWRFRMVSAAGSTFIQDMGFDAGDGAMPGVSTFRGRASGHIERIASAPFGPMDPFCSAWHLFALLADGAGEWSPQFRY